MRRGGQKGVRWMLSLPCYSSVESIRPLEVELLASHLCGEGQICWCTEELLSHYLVPCTDIHTVWMVQKGHQTWALYTLTFFPAGANDSAWNKTIEIKAHNLDDSDLTECDLRAESPGWSVVIAAGWKIDKKESETGNFAELSMSLISRISGCVWN